MNKTKIDWCDSTWNPVTGCLHGCECCYARRIVNRFEPFDFMDWSDYHIETGLHILENKVKTECKDGKLRTCAYPYGFEPTLHRYRINDYVNKKKGRTIFVCSMADLFGECVPDEWIREVFKACAAAPQHNYLFLTKNPERYKEFERFYTNNMWFGMSYTHLIDGIIPGARDLLWLHNQILFMSIEPILEPLHLGVMREYIDWVILGAETGNRKDKVVPKREWIENIVGHCKAYNVPIFMKSSLSDIWGEPLIQDFPEQLRSNQE